MKSSLCRFVLPALLFVAVFLGGCASSRQTTYLPYSTPSSGNSDSSAPVAVISTVTDNRPDSTMNIFLKTDFESFVRESLSGELQAAGVFRAGTAPSTTSEPDYWVSVAVQDVSWAVPNHSGMAKTAFWTSFLTGGLGGLAYGSTSTPVYGRAEIRLKVIQRETGSVILEQSFEALHEEHTAKLKCDTMETRARVMAEAWKIVAGKIITAVRGAMKPATTTE